MFGNEPFNELDINNGSTIRAAYLNPAIKRHIYFSNYEKLLSHASDLGVKKPLSNLNELRFPFQAFLLTNNSLFCLSSQIEFRYDVEKHEIASNQESQIGELSRHYIGLADDTTAAILTEMLNALGDILSLEDRNSYEHICKLFIHKCHVPPETQQILFFPEMYFVLSGTHVYLKCRNLSNNFISLQLVSQRLLKIQLCAQNLTENYRYARDFYEILRSTLNNPVGAGINSDPIIRFLRPDGQPDWSINYQYEVDSFAFYYENSCIDQATAWLNLSKSALYTNVKSLIGTITSGNEKNLYLLAEFFALIFSNQPVTEYLWVLEGTYTNITNFNRFIASRGIKCHTYSNLDNLCKLEALELLQNYQANGYKLIVSLNSKIELSRTKSRLKSMLRGEPLSGPKRELWDEKYSLNMVFVYETTSENIESVKSALSGIPIKILKINAFDPSQLTPDEIMQFSIKLSLLGLKTIIGKQRAVPYVPKNSDNTISEFLGSCCTKTSDNQYTLANDLYEAYKAFCLSNDMTPLGKYTALKEISAQRKLRYEPRRSEGNLKVIYGIQLNSGIVKPCRVEQTGTKKSFEDLLDEVLSFDIIDFF